MKRLLPFVFVLMLVGGTFAGRQYRDFTDIKGRTIRGCVLAFDEHSGTVSFERDNQRTSKVPITIFSEADQDYIKNWCLLRGFRDPSRFKISVKKKNGKTWKKTGEIGGVSTKEVRYDIVLENRNDLPLENVSVEYRIFLRAKGNGRWVEDFYKALGSSQDLLNPLPVLGEGKYAEIPSKGTMVLETKYARTVKEKVNGGIMDVFGEYFETQEVVLEGVWVRVTTVIDGETIMREVFAPDTLRGKYEWK